MRQAVRLCGLLALAAGAATAGVFDPPTPPPPAPYHYTAVPIEPGLKDLAGLLRDRYNCWLRLEQGTRSLAAACPDSGPYLVVRGASAASARTLVETLFLEKAAQAARLPGDRRREPSFAVMEQVNRILKGRAKPCVDKDFPAKASCGAQAMAQANALRLGTGEMKDGQYCESYYSAAVRSLYPVRRCGVEVEADRAAE